MKTLSLLVLLGFVALAASAGITNDWQKVEDENLKEYEFNFRIGLKPQNLATMDRLFWEISDPKSPFYGQFLTNEQIADLISLPKGDIQKVMDHVTAHSGEFCDVKAESSLHREYIEVSTCAGQAEYIFPNIKLAVFEGPRGVKIVRSELEMDIAHNANLLGLPTELHQYVDTIQYVTDFPLNVTKALSPATEPYASDAELLDVQDMNKFFETDYSLLEKSTIDADDGQVRIGVIELDLLAFSASGLASFQKKYNIPADPVKKVVGFQLIPNPEPDADVQFLTGIGQNMQVWDFVFYDSSFTFGSIIDKIMGTSGAPKIYSLSYAAPENYVGESKINSSNTAFMKFGLAGFTFLSAAGDVGPVLDYKDCSIFDAEYPATSPYVTSVGGNSVNKTNQTIQAWMHGSGGFSTFQKRPSFQDKHVEAYLAQNEGMPANTNGKKFNTNNRAYPDVSAFGAHSLINYGGKFVDVEGTSLACPEFVALLAMVNAYRHQNNLGPLGPLNQALYSIEGGIGTDVVNGMSYATSRFGCKGDYLPGFKAVQGWDPVTGLGSPHFPTLVKELGHIGTEKSSTKDVKELIPEFLPLN